MKGKATHILARYRLPVFAVAASILIAAAAWATRDGTIFNFHEYCPLAPVCIFFTLPASGVIWPWGLFFFGVLLISALFVRRLFCGWICPVGLAQDILYLPRRLLKKSATTPPASHRRLSTMTRLVLLALTLFLPFATGSMFFAQLCPMIRIGDVLYRVDVAGGVATLAVFLFLSLVIECFFCRFVCPLGLLLGWTGMLGAKLFPTITIRKTCTAGEKCGTCADACPMKIDLCTATDRIDDTECTLCLACVRQCRCYHFGDKT